MEGQSGACGLHCTKINHMGVKFGKEVILKDVNIHVHCGQLTVIIGRNGAGKSTLLKAILGEVEHKRKSYKKNQNWLCATKNKYRKTYANNCL